MPKFTTEYRDLRTGLPHLSQIEAHSTEEAQRMTLHRGLGERVTSRSAEGVDRARTAEPSARLECFLREQSVATGLDALGALAHVAHLAACSKADLDLLQLLSDSGLFQGVLQVVRSVLAGNEVPQSRDLVDRLRFLELRVAGLPSELRSAPLPADRREPAAEIRRLRALLLQASFDLERLAIQPIRNEEDRQALHDRAQALRWGLSGDTTKT